MPTNNDILQPVTPNRILRWSVVGMEAMYAKMFDPPTDSRPTPDQLNPTNPVPEVMAAAGFQKTPSRAHVVQRGLLHGLNIPTWDNRPGGMQFMTIGDSDNPTASGGTFPGPTTRVPRGVVFHGETSGFGPPPHTIHWHGIEPTPMNDGVGHCSIEIGHYTYQWQANFIGTYFMHCHRNTVQHFEFGLYSLLLIEPSDTYFATQTLGIVAAPIGHCRDGKRRIAANVGPDAIRDLAGVPLTALTAPVFPNFIGGKLTDPDPWTGDPALKFATNPHAMTVAYDVEALWVLDDRDSNWSDNADNARATFPRFGSIPGVNDDFTQSPGANGFFAFNDFAADYWYVTGVPVPAARIDKGGTGIGTIPAVVDIPPELNSGITGSQIPIHAEVNQTILVRCLDAAYNSMRIKFPVNITIIAWDGRALGQPPFGMNHAYVVPAGEWIEISVARRFDALIRETVPFSGVATVEFIETRGENVTGFHDTLMTALIPINIGVAPPVPVTFTVAGSVLPPLAGVIVTAAPKSPAGNTVTAPVDPTTGSYSLAGLLADNYQITPSLAGYTFLPGSNTDPMHPESALLLINANVPALAFTASKVLAKMSVISGRVTDKTGAAVAGASVKVTPTSVGGSAQQTELTDASGNYALSGRLNGTYLITPTLAGFNFTPANISVTINNLDAPAQNFVSAPVDPTAEVPDDFKLEEALESLKMAVKSKGYTAADLKRLDVAPLLKGKMTPDGKIDLQDVLVILRRVVGLPL